MMEYFGYAVALLGLGFLGVRYGKNIAFKTFGLADAQELYVAVMEAIDDNVVTPDEALQFVEDVKAILDKHKKV